MLLSNHAFVSGFESPGGGRVVLPGFAARGEASVVAVQEFVDDVRQYITLGLLSLYVHGLAARIVGSDGA
jgi:hypothetical protein